MSKSDTNLDTKTLDNLIRHEKTLTSELESVIAQIRQLADNKAPAPQIKSLGTFIEMLKKERYLVLDTETTGLNDGEICQIAILQADGKVLLDTLIQTMYPIPPNATRIHGITDEMVKDSPTWKEIGPAIINLVQGKDLVVYNATYDRKMMRKSSEVWGLAKTEWKEIANWWCAMKMFAEIYGDWNAYRGNYRWQKLATAASFYSVEQNGAHTALADCLTTLGICKAMANHKVGE